MRKTKIVITKLRKRLPGNKPLYRVTKLINSKRLSLLDTDFEEVEIQHIIDGFPLNYDYQIIQGV